MDRLPGSFSTDHSLARDHAVDRSGSKVVLDLKGGDIGKVQCSYEDYQRRFPKGDLSRWCASIDWAKFALAEIGDQATELGFRGHKAFTVSESGLGIL
jgi:hypothetical protein